jgi:alkaline phosphatase D
MLIVLPAALALAVIGWLEPRLIGRPAPPAAAPAVATDAAKPAAAVPQKAAAQATGGGEAKPEAKPSALISPELLRAATPATPWRTLDPETRLTRIGIGSCLSQRHPQPIWQGVRTAKPQLFLMVGDNVYGDIKSADKRELAEAYAEQLKQPEFAAARAELPFLGIWDDHDYGLNDAGKDFVHREAAEALFRAFWSLPAEPGRGGGVYYARVYGPPGQRVQIIMLDTRSFRDALKLKEANFPHWGKYGPDLDASKTILGAAQWSWLEQQLKVPAELRLVVSSIQVLAEGHGFERWGNLPAERDRLLKLIETTGAKGVLVVSGDRHVGALYNRPLSRGQVLAEITASSLNRSYGPSKDTRTPELVSDIHHAENFGLIAIDWDKRVVTLSLHGMAGEDLDDLTIRFADLGMPQ